MATTEDDVLAPATPSPGVPVAPSTGVVDIVRSGAELVELSERFFRGIFVSCVVFVGLSGVAALALLPLRQSDATYTDVTVLLTALLVAVTPLAVWRAEPLYRLLRLRPQAQIALVLLSAALVAYPLRSELWWPSCALLMLVATLTSLARTLAYVLFVLVCNLLAHLVAGDLDDIQPVTVIGLWIGYGFWATAFALVPDRLAVHVLRLNSRHRAAIDDAPVRVSAVATVISTEPTPPETPSVPAPPPDTPQADAALRRLSARQLQVVALLADGMLYEEVAACLSISVGQVQRHVTGAVARLDVRNANELVALAVGAGMVPGSRE